MIDFSLLNPQLDGDPFFWKGSEIGLLLIHGFTATTTEVRLLAKRFYADGYTVSSPLLPGHGTSPQDMNSRTWQEWVKHVEIAYLDLKRQCETVIVGGESMGALLALNLASRHPEIRLVLAYSPALKVHLLWASQFLYPFEKYRPKLPGIRELAWKGYKCNPMKASMQLYKLQRIVKSRINLIHQPVAIFLGAEDHTIDQEGGIHLFDQLPPGQKSIFSYAHSSHCMILDRELDAIYDQSKVFINQVLMSSYKAKTD